MVLRLVSRKVLLRLRLAVKKEQKRTKRKLPIRMMKLFGKLKNIDERKLREYGHIPGMIAEVGRKSMSPGYAVRVLKVKGTKGVVLKFPTSAKYHLNVTPREEIRFVRKMIGMVNERLPNSGFVLLKPIGHPVGPFIAMNRTNIPVVEDFYES
ncbi:MAG: hypothetical protein NTY48_06150, partial [Candidatus Diapherotrites archaeon]|nr:hypothetical protein [Candidatus Diapherotrites archaeon]